MNKEDVLLSIEEFYCQRLSELVNEDRIDDSDSIYQEFVIDSDGPDEWLFLEYIADVC